MHLNTIQPETGRTASSCSIVIVVAKVMLRVQMARASHKDGIPAWINALSASGVPNA